MSSIERWLKAQTVHGNVILTHNRERAADAREAGLIRPAGTGDSEEYVITRKGWEVLMPSNPKGKKTKTLSAVEQETILFLSRAPHGSSDRWGTIPTLMKRGLVEVGSTQAISDTLYSLTPRGERMAKELKGKKTKKSKGNPARRLARLTKI